MPFPVRAVRTVAKNYPAVRRRYRVYAPAVKQLASDVMYLKGLINSEPHFFTTQNANNVDYNGYVVDFSLVPQNDTVSGRTGNRFLPRYFSLNMSWGMGNASTVKKVTARIILFRWYADQRNSPGSPTPTEVLSVIGSQYAPLAHLNNDITGPKGDRVRAIEVLHNEIESFDSTGSNWSKVCKLNIDLNPKSKAVKEHMEFLSATTQSPNSGGLYLLLITDNATSTEFGFQLEGKLTFYDN